MSSNLKLERVCEYCNNTFVAKKTTTRFCSHTCNSRAYHDSVKGRKLLVAKNEFLQKKLHVPENIESLNCKPYLNIKETCLLLNASDSTIRKMIKDVVLPTMRIGKKHLIRKTDIEKQFKVVR